MRENDGEWLGGRVEDRGRGTRRESERDAKFPHSQSRPSRGLPTCANSEQGDLSVSDLVLFPPLPLELDAARYVCAF